MKNFSSLTNIFIILGHLLKNIKSILIPNFYDEVVLLILGEKEIF